MQPLQTPKLKSAGIAFSEYVKADDYSSTEPRRGHLWVEFAQKPADKLDQYYCRAAWRAPFTKLSASGLWSNDTARGRSCQ